MVHFKRCLIKTYRAKNRQANGGFFDSLRRIATLFAGKYRKKTAILMPYQSTYFLAKQLLNLC